MPTRQRRIVVPVVGLHGPRQRPSLEDASRTARPG